MTSAKKYGIQEFTTKLPDFLLQFVDANIKNDVYGALRSNYLSQKIDNLIPQHLQSTNKFYIFIDSKGNNHITMDSEEFSRLSKGSESLPKKDRQLLPITKQIYYSLEFEPKNILSTLLKQEQLDYVSKIKMISMDEIRIRCQANLYFSPEQIISDICSVIAWNQVYRASSKRSFIHLSNFYEKFNQLIAKRKFISKFYEKKNKDFQELQKLETQFKLPIPEKQWPFIPQKFRQYEHLENYVPTPLNRTAIIQQRLRSQKVPVQCPQNCVCYRQDLKSNQQFCNYSLAQVWQSDCPNRKSKIQCNHSDPQKAKHCRNSQIKNKDRKKVKQSNQDQNSQIEEFMAWGIDLFTRNVIFNCLPQLDILQFIETERNTQKKHRFVQRTLQIALNFLGQQGYNIVSACHYIIKNGHMIQSQVNKQNKKYQWKAKILQKKQINSQKHLFTQLDVLYASTLLKNKQYVDSYKPNNQLFRIHTKGKGAKCIAQQGIKRGTFIVQYFGEIYQPWRWYERQDFIKQMLKKKKYNNKVTPEFYNIYLEKHKDQPLGYDILVVDPIKKGNFSSRFSHSCTPNCGTVSTVSNGKYIIGMYSIKDIEYGQQFTFDYCSMTQSNYQHQNSICLCGTKQCRGYYLQLATNKIYNNLMDSNCCFHFRNSLMLKSLGKVTEQQIQTCNNFNIKQGMLKQIPQWLHKWCSIILKSIQNQSQKYEQQLKQSWLKQYPWQCKNQTEQQKNQKIQLYAKISKSDLINLRFQNLITTIDKIKYYLQSIQDDSPPLHFQNKLKICDYLIQNQNKDSILILLQDQCTNQKMKQQTMLIQQFLRKIRALDAQMKDKVLNEIQIQQICQLKLFYFRLCCLCVSHQILCKAKVQNSNRLLLSDIILFYAFTHTYFTPHQYKTHTSEQIKVTLKEILGQNSNAGKFSDKTKKRYTSPSVWGQMVSWYKQTIVNPEASLSQDRRGTLSYPLINSILKSNYPFEKHARFSFLKTLRQKPASSWPPAQGCELSYKNPYKCYGTMLFESIHNQQIFKQLSKGSLIDSVLDIINSSLADKIHLFKEVEFITQKIPPNSELYNILDNLELKMDRCPPAEVIQMTQKAVPQKKHKKIPSKQTKQIINSDSHEIEKSQNGNKSIVYSQPQKNKQQNFEE